MNHDQYAYVYILSNGFKKLYIGVTTELEERIREHKEKTHSRSHTAKYNITRLVYFERFSMISAAIVREKQLKGWLRIRKLELIISTNPTWRDLSEEWGKPIQLYQWPSSAAPKTAND
jgi:putative endonuclease